MVRDRLLTAPLVFVAVHSSLSLFLAGLSARFSLEPNGSSPASPRHRVGIMVGICEELGWFGFAIPIHRRRPQRPGHRPASSASSGERGTSWQRCLGDPHLFRGARSAALCALVGPQFPDWPAPAFPGPDGLGLQQTGSLLLMMVMHSA